MVATAFHDLPASAFPLVIELFEPDDRDCLLPVHRIDIAEPGAVRIPGFGRGRPLRVRITLASGEVTVH